MLTNPVFILAIIALILAAISYIGQPTLGAAVDLNFGGVIAFGSEPALIQ